MTTTASPQRSEKLNRTIEVINGAIVSAESQGRQDFVERLTKARARALDPRVTLLVVGEFKQGKSSLINALLNTSICPVDDDVATSVITVIEHAEEANASVYKRTDDGPVKVPIGIDEVADYASEAGNPQNIQGIESVQVGLPRQFLSQGVRIVDTPGVGGLESSHGMSTLGALPMAEAVIFVSDASQELTAPEVSFLKTAKQMCPNIVNIMSKVDFYPEWRRIKELNERHLRSADINPLIIPVSSTLRHTAVQNNDRELNAECGFPTFVQFLNREVIASAEQLAIRAATSDVISVLEQLRATLRTEKDLLEDPSQSETMIADLERAKVQAEQLRTAASRWQSTLGDGFADLSSNIDHDLRERVRGITAEVDAAIDDNDPEKIAAELYPWIEQRVMAEVIANYRYLTEAAEELATRVEDHFSGDESELVAQLDIKAPVLQLHEVGGISVDAADKQTAAQSLLMAMRSSYGGMMMFGVLGGVVGMAMFGPVTLGAGVLMGRKAIKDDKKRQLMVRRQQAKQALRKYIDEVSFNVTKDSRDTLRRVQREIRDTNMERAKQLQRTTGEALQAAQTALKTSSADRSGRIAELAKSLDRLGRIEAACRELAPEIATGSGRPS
ncbi:MAG: dynamin family protein [Acidimicrobiales bacterium]